MGNIVWMASYPKSGNTWMRAFLHNYLSTGKTASNINQLDRYFANESNVSWYLPLLDGELRSKSLEEICEHRARVQRQIASTRQGTVMVKTHNFLGEFEGHALHDMSITSGAVVVVRNPLDVVISLADHFGLSLDDAITFMGSDKTGTPSDENNVASMLGSWSTHVDSWTRDSSGTTCTVRYEDLLDKPRKQFARVLAFLGLERDPTRLQQAMKHSSFNSLRALEKQHGFIEKSPNSRRFFRSGKKNQWVGVLSETQITTLIYDHREMMEKFKYLPPAHR
jgi:hypothetical protein